MVAVRRYLRYGLSYRDVEELLAERGIEVDHVTVYRWVQRFTPLLADAARFARHLIGGGGQAYGDLGPPGVGDHIGQALLQDPEHLPRDGTGHGQDRPADRGVDPDA